MLFRKYPKPLMQMTNMRTSSTSTAIEEYVPTKLRAKHRVQLKTLAGRKKRYNVKTALLCNKKATNANAQKPKAQRELLTHNKKNKKEYIQGLINKIRNLVAWQTVNEVTKTKLKTSCPEEGIQ